MISSSTLVTENVMILSKCLYLYSRYVLSAINFYVG